MNRLYAAAGEGRYRIEATAVLCGEDLMVSFTGGEKAHIGAVSLAVYEPVRQSATVSTLTVYTHRDDQLSSRAAKALSVMFCCTAGVSVGIHVEEATEKEIEKLCGHFEECLQKIEDQIRETKKR